MTSGSFKNCYLQSILQIMYLIYILYTLPMNINGYVPFLINTLDTIVRE